MTDKRRVDNVVGITNTLWALNKYRLLDYIEEKSHTPVPVECYDLIEVAFRCGAAMMESAIGRERR